MNTINTIETNLILDHDMANELELDAIENYIIFNKRNYKLGTLMISYYEVYPLSGGTPDGKIEIFGSNDAVIWSKLSEHIIDNVDNLDSAFLFENTYNLEYLKIKYIPNNIAFGFLNANGLYLKWNLLT